MALMYSVNSVDAGSVTIYFTGPEPYSTIECQFSARRDFQFCVCPIITMPTSYGRLFGGLNRASTYWFRARGRFAGANGALGAVEDWSAPIAFRTALGAGAQLTAPAQVMIAPAMIVLPERPIGYRTIPAGIAGFPIENVSIDSPVGFKTNAGNQFTIDLVFGGQPYDTIAILNTNLSEGTQVTLTAAPSIFDFGTASEVYLLPPNQPFRASRDLTENRNGWHGLFNFPTQTKPAVRLAFTTANVPAETQYVEHIIVGKNRATKNHSVDKTETPIPRGSIDRTRSGIPDRVDGLVMRKAEFEISMMTEAQYELSYADLMYHENEAVLVVPNSKSGGFLHDRILYGDLKGSRVQNPSSPRYTRAFSIESLI